MSTASYKTIQALEQVVKPLPVGTNLALLHLMWAMLRGAFLQGRGAVHTALSESGFSDGEIRRSWQALRYGKWDIRELVTRWRQLALSEKRWQTREYEGWRPVAVDITAFWRPQLKFWSNKFFHRLANRLIKGVGFGVITQVGEIDGQRLPLLKRIIRANPRSDGETELKATILRQVPLYLDEQEVFVHDAGASIADMHDAEIPRFVIRLAVNCTGRRNHLPSKKKRGRPAEYGQLIRPLPRQRGGNLIPATGPDMTTRFQFSNRTIEVQGWTGLVRTEQKVSVSNKAFTVWVFHDPLYKKPLVLGTNLSAQAETIYRLYLDRWPVEQPPLVAKQMLGLHRQFVFAPIACHRLPELALLAGNILTYLAATLPPIPTGFWDRHPKKRLDGFVEHYPRLIFPKLTHLMRDFEKSSLLPHIYPKELSLIAG
ncbi:MAG: hypothetical protein H6667_25805 [Ardenticatenaceae bacterium]|nr:hypothetical protein [Ardenticatenaceae bacterium]MCB9423238.1 hypothetical protein [Ardenticatenaceae bacterium]